MANRVPPNDLDHDRSDGETLAHPPLEASLQLVTGATEREQRTSPIRCDRVTPPAPTPIGDNGRTSMPAEEFGVWSAPAEPTAIWDRNPEVYVIDEGLARISSPLKGWRPPLSRVG